MGRAQHEFWKHQLRTDYQRRRQSFGAGGRQVLLLTFKIGREPSHKAPGLRLYITISNIWNFAVLEAGGVPCEVVEEMEDAEAAARAAERLFSGNGPIEKMSRKIDRLEMGCSKDLKIFNVPVFNPFA